MRNLKKVIALVAVFAMLVSTVAFAGSYTDVADTDNYAEAIEMLSSLNILTGDKDVNGNAVFRPNDSITRAEVATIVERIQAINNVAPTATQFTDVPAAHWASGYIAQAAGQGIINGYGDGTFGPEDNVLYEQAVKMLVETLGYAPFVEANGGYYAGHLLAASRYGILDGVKGAAPGQEATRGQVAQLVYNAIETPIMERSAFGTEAKYEIFDGGKDGTDEFITLLTRDLGVVKGTGIVSANAVSGDIDTSEEEEIDFILDDSTKEYNCYDLEDLDDGTVYANGTNAGAYIGLEVTFYAEKIKKGEYNLISIAPTSRNKTMSISLSDVISFDGEEIKYYDGDSVDEVSLAKDAEYITLSYNGVNVDYDDLEDAFDFYFDDAFSGQVTLVDNGTARGYSIIALEVAVSAVVDSVEDTVVTFKNEVVTVDDKAFETLDFDPEETDTLIKLSKDGAAFDYAQLKEWDVISILANDANEYYVANVIESGKITGAVQEYSDGEWKINGQWYEIAEGGYKVDAIKTTSEGTFYIDAYGKIVAFDKASSTLGVSSDKYAYIVETIAKEDEWEKWNVRVQYLDKDGKFYNAYLASKVTIENISDELATALEEVDGVSFEPEEDEEGAELYNVAKINMDKLAKNEVVIGKIADALENQFVTYELSSDAIKTITFALDGDNDEVSIITKAKAGTAEYSEEDKEVKIDGKKFEVSDDTIVFFIASSTGNVLDDAIATKERSKVATTAVLPTKADYKQIVAYDVDDNDVPAVLVVYDEASLVSPSINIAVIEAVGDATVDGEKVKSITYWMNGAKATAYTDADTEAYVASDFAAGDIWKLIVDGTTITDAKFVADYSRDNRDEAGVAGAVTITKNEGIDEEVFYGPVVKKTSSKVYYAANNLFGADMSYDSFKTGDANVYVVDYTRKGKITVSAGLLGDAKVNSKLIDMAEGAALEVYDKNADDKPTIKETVEGVERDVKTALGMMDYVVAVSYDEDVQDIIIYKAMEFDGYAVRTAQ